MKSKIEIPFGRLRRKFGRLHIDVWIVMYLTWNCLGVWAEPSGNFTVALGDVKNVARGSTPPPNPRLLKRSIPTGLVNREYENIVVFRAYWTYWRCARQANHYDMS